MGHKKRCNQAELARILGVTSPTLTKFKHEPSFPPFDKDNMVEIYAGCVWWYIRKEANPVPSDEGLMVGGETDGLERYRLARAQQEEIKLAETRRQVVMLSDFTEAIEAVLQPYRQLAEFAKRKNDDELWQQIEECNQQVLSGLERIYGPADATTPDPLD